MCGFAGLLGPNLDFSKGATERTLSQMIARIVHRGPDSDGVWADPAAGIALGHKRLAIIDISPNGAQPMHSPSGRYVTAYNGEVYNHADLRAELDASETPVCWRGHSDTETLLAGFDAWGIEPTIARSIGMFAMAVWDRQNRELTLVRDRMGEKPLYYGWQRARGGAVFFFGSELKAFLPHPAFEAEIDRDALCLLMRYGYIGGEHSIYRGIRKLPPGCMATLSLDAPTARLATYWSAAEIALSALSEESGERSPGEVVDELEELLRRAVRRQMVADVPVGAFHSGGIDSSTVVALMQGCSTTPVKTFTIGVDDPRINEAVLAKRVADHLGTEHTELYIGEQDLFGVLPELPKIYCEPFADSSQIPTVLVARLARQRVTVSISGDGGDELFCGYDHYRQLDSLWRGMRRVPSGVRKLAARMATSVPVPTWDALSRPIRPASGGVGQRIHRVARYSESRSLSELQRMNNSKWTEPPVIGGVEPSWPATEDDILEDLHPLDQMMVHDIRTFLADDVLTKVDRASMSVSLESRAPLLDHSVVEFALRLPAEFKLREGRSKWALREVLYRHVPREIVDRPKSGFRVPIATWLRGPLRDWASELLDPRRIREEGYLDADPIARAWDEHLSGRFDWRVKLWKVLMFQAWLEESRNTQAVPAAADTRVSA